MDTILYQFEPIVPYNETYVYISFNFKWMEITETVVSAVGCVGVVVYRHWYLVGDLGYSCNEITSTISLTQILDWYFDTFYNLEM